MLTSVDNVWMLADAVWACFFTVAPYSPHRRQRKRLYCSTHAETHPARQIASLSQMEHFSKNET